MHALLSAAGRAWIRGFFAALIVYAYGILAAPNLNAALLLAAAALVGAIAGGVRALGAYVPFVTFHHWLKEPYADWADAFVQAFVGTLVVSLVSPVNTPSLSDWRSIWTSAIVGAANAGLRAIQGAITVGEFPGKTKGVPRPPRLPERQRV